MIELFVVFIVYHILPYLLFCVLVTICIEERIISRISEMETLLKDRSYKEATVVVSVDLTPSEACKSNAENKQKYGSLLMALGISVKSPINGDEYNGVLGKFSFKWEKNQNELACYSVVQEYLRGRNICSHISGNGKSCVDGFLFNKDVYSLRPYGGAHAIDLPEHEKPVRKFTIHGTPDLIIVDEGSKPQYYMSNHVKYALEIKTVSAMQRAAGVTMCLKEGILNLIGLNVDNSFASPPVIVTDLIKKNYVLYVETKAQNPLEYEVQQILFTNFRDAVSHVENVLLNRERHIRDCCTRDFGRPGSAPSVIPVPEPVVDTTLDDYIDEVDELEDLLLGGGMDLSLSSTASNTAKNKKGNRGRKGKK